MTWLRAIAAAGLSVLLPGAGHAVLRDWVRALLFAGLYFTTVWLFFPTDQLAAAGSMSEMMDVAADIDTMTQLTILFVTMIAALDATFRALGFPPESGNGDGDGPSCPECGKALDEDLEFCHWCTTRLEPKANEEEPTKT
ncbi:zinc ribbon domain-containing protein [Natronolimnohabitans sp. A-GB9]|uniref:zinc ribbon domain-containing protein n=1 Tax=Natronolimnohabitans sp. A-GB9 TaxID=3069757 RepID=UPI0027B35E91|nr:zinc ribbon domain-containing protein [Natronolimnohabitans sp. A-GB9]MDQ2049897.1 zinc ribbon domain-containing protein [Natronolimnohabitans sp. A-GB9]